MKRHSAYQFISDLNRNYNSGWKNYQRKQLICIIIKLTYNRKIYFKTFVEKKNKNFTKYKTLHTEYRYVSDRQAVARELHAALSTF